MRESVPSARYSPICNALRQWKTSLIPIYRVYRLYDNKKKNAKWRYFTSRGAHVNCAIIIFLGRDIPPFVMYCVNGKPRSSLFIESTDFMIYTYRLTNSSISDLIKRNTGMKYKRGFFAQYSHDTVRTEGTHISTGYRQD